MEDSTGFMGLLRTLQEDTHGMVNASVPFSVYGTNSFSGINFGNVKRVTDTFHEVSLHSSRNGAIEPGGYHLWFVTGGDITINNTRYQIGVNDRSMTPFPLQCTEREHYYQR